MRCLEVSGAVRPIYGSLGVKRLTNFTHSRVPFHNLTVPLAGKEIPHKFVEPEGSLPSSQQQTTYLYLGPDVSSPRTPPPCSIPLRSILSV